MNEETLFSNHLEYGNNPATVSEIRALEARFQVQLPLDYREFLSRRNGGEFTNVRIRTPWHPKGGDQLRSLFGVGAGAEDGDILGDEADVALFNDNDTGRIDVLPIGETLLSSLLLMTFGNNRKNRVVIKKAFDATGYEILCESFSGLFDLLEPVSG